ncbi:protein-disulfide reductase DsbD family protein [Parabacteroides distasonis]|uniref:protein-disulfide reductase DsbD family protein n=1 Tax=Parabacteroides distasonis TaxID=823 RepID=UPI00189E65AE|nr:cytochrome c biogenesis protein CcdA [Parabacteroides distasonis]MDB9152973.1 thioredoxin family protein [Parabacteroides distasonis]MDB9157550.1 thioredoxin family protein [Parabacteroides distasonis]MDB9163913.1 thioredoxin family protein [Parabacteroides distasonis]MDB9167845.1 thioredoxin family protein [Parabacteroides distasonis]MDB9195861.1 thioredoxin family protein [Parabacteroides distasonis]
MKKLISSIMLALIALVAQAQILTPVKWKIKLDDKGGAPEKEIVFTATADKGWHLYDMNLPEGGPVSTSFTFETLNGAELIGQPVPSVKPTTVYDEQFAMNLRWYPGTVSFTQKLKVTDPAKFKAEGEVEFMACNDETCLPPDQIPFSFDKKSIHVDPALAANSSTTEVDKEDATTVQPDTQVVAEDASELNTPDPAAKETPATTSPKASDSLTDSPNLWSPVIDQLKLFGDSTVSAADTSWLFIFFAGFLGGLIALLTPCVWPMIPMTVSFFLKRTKDRKKAIRDAVTYGLSIIVIYLVMGLLITGIFGASALNDLSTNAIFNILFFLLLVVFAVSFFGAFELVLPASWTSKLDSKADSTTGILSIFFMSFTLVLVSFSCTGPIIGTLLVQAASMGTAVGPAIGMFGFALALSIPFSVFAIFPNMLQSMPKSGGWLNSVKVVLGFLELALALKFLSVADLAYGWRLLDREAFIVLWIVIFSLLGVYLLGKIKFSHDSEVKYVSVPRLFMAIISFAFAIYMVPGLWGAPLKAISAFAPPLYTQDFNLYKNEVHAAFDDYESGMAYAKKVNKPVMIDFSGFGCVNCRKMEASVWTDPKVKQMLENDYVLITLMVDDKTKLPQPIEIQENGKTRKLKTIGDKWSYLQRSKFGSNAQPFYILLNDEGQPLGPSYAFNEDVSKYIQFLQNGLKEFKKEQQ